MSYDQYSEYAHTGGSESAKNRISPNTYHVAASEDVGYPNKFDLFVNKENASIGGFSVTENHALTDLVGDKLYLDHRLYVDTTGGGIAVDPSEGVVNTGSIDLSESSLLFSTSPTSETFTVQYSARSDKSYDSHINAMQNVLMKMQDRIGLQDGGANPTGDGAGITTMPFTVELEPVNQANLDALRTLIAPNMILMNHLEAAIKIGSSSNVAIDSHNGAGHHILLGNPTAAGASDTVHVDTTVLTVGNKSGASSGNFTYSMSPEDHIFVSGDSVFASQMTVGQPWAGTGQYQGSIPNDMTGFYNEAMLRVNGPLYFGSGISGVGNVTFVVATGQLVDIVGTLESTDLHVENTSIFDGVSTFNSIVNITSPGRLRTNRDIEMLTKPNGEPGLVDNLDASYARAVTESRSQVLGSVSNHILSEDFYEDYANPYTSGYKLHPVHHTKMYPMLGGWAFTGAAAFAIAGSHSHKNVLICSTNISSISGATIDNYGSYAPGLFNPGDTFVEIDNGGSEQLSYPVYYHSDVVSGTAVSTVTGFSLYLAGDDDVLESPTVLNKGFKIYQPSNVPLKHLTSDFTNPAAPEATFGNQAGGYYSDGAVHRTEFATNSAWVGPSVGPDPYPVYKEMAAGDTVQSLMLTALQRSVDLEKATAISGGMTFGTETGVAYLYATTSNNRGTEHDQVLLKASPSPWGIAASNIWQDGFSKVNPGQWAPVGEVTASTVNGNDWVHIETTSYRPNAFYDSCWVPLVQHHDSTRAVPYDSIPENMGRCLGILGVNDNATLDNDTMYAEGQGDATFYVEHNIGPVPNLSEVSLRAFVARYADDYKQEVEQHWNSIFRSTARGSANLWTPEPTSDIYGSQHDFHQTLTQGNGNGNLREITNSCSIRYLDSRFCTVSIMDSQTSSPSGLPGGPLTYGDYIRVVIKRTR
jgi:hypothetical protein